MLTLVVWLCCLLLISFLLDEFSYWLSIQCIKLFVHDANRYNGRHQEIDSLVHDAIYCDAVGWIWIAPVLPAKSNLFITRLYRKTHCCWKCCIGVHPSSVADFCGCSVTYTYDPATSWVEKLLTQLTVYRCLWTSCNVFINSKAQLSQLSYTRCLPAVGGDGQPSL